MGDIELTSAELELSADERRAWAMLLHVALVGWGDDFGGTEATALLGLLTRLSSLARAGLEAGKAEESMRERAALEAEGIGEAYGMDETGWTECSETIATAIRALPLTGDDKP